MRSIFLILTITFLALAAVAQAATVNLAGEARIAIPNHWTLGSDSLHFPAQIVFEDRSGELLVFKSTLSADQAITNERDLKLSVQKVVDNVILTLPEAKLLTNTGFYDGSRTGFIIEFISRDTSSQIDLRHRFEGILYRTLDGDQVLFTLWAKAALDRYDSQAESIKAMQESFAYLGPHEANVFAPAHRTYWYLVLVLFAVIVMLYYNRIRKAKRNGSENSNVTGSWTCSCGRLNSSSQSSCLRCGRDRYPAAKAGYPGSRS
ncbi:MAG TPA: hypothetical protein VMS71_00850 [Candidatus Acidoferrum sp.]|nr:hypothetical protein [Candidatus Acidoferrum sp.]